jgi:hypothetical protein
VPEEKSDCFDHIEKPEDTFCPVDFHGGHTLQFQTIRRKNFAGGLAYLSATRTGGNVPIQDQLDTGRGMANSAWGT